jgi:hypothetical protein
MSAHDGDLPVRETRCDEMRPLLLEDVRDAAAEAHARSCQACQRFVAEHELLWAVLAEYAPPVPESGDDLRERVLESARVELRRGRGLIHRIAWTAAAASVLVGVMLVTRGDSQSESSALELAALEEAELETVADEAMVGEVLDDLPAEDRVFVAMLHLSDELDLLDEEISNGVDLAAGDLDDIDVGASEEDALALALVADLYRR